MALRLSNLWAGWLTGALLLGVGGCNVEDTSLDPNAGRKGGAPSNVGGNGTSTVPSNENSSGGAQQGCLVPAVTLSDFVVFSGGSGVTVGWSTDATVIREWRVRRDGQPLISLPGTARSHEDTTALSGGTYRYLVEGVDTCARVVSSVEKSVTVPLPPAGGPPSVALVSPVTGSAFATGRGIVFNTNVTAAANTSLARVEMLAGSSIVCTATAAPWSCTWTNPPAGQHLVKARAVTTANLSAETSPATIQVLALVPAADDFNDNALDNVTWVAEITAATLREAGGQLELLPNANASGLALLRNRTPLDLTGKSVIVQVKEIPNQAVSTTETWLEVMPDPQGDDWFEIMVVGGMLVADVGVNDNVTEVGTVPFNLATMSWWRLREQAGRWYADYAPSSTGPWTTLGSAQTSFGATQLYFDVAVNFESTGTPGRAVFDNLNVP